LVINNANAAACLFVAWLPGLFIRFIYQVHTAHTKQYAQY